MIGKQLLGILFFFGLVVASTDGAWFPWANFAGVAMMAAAVFFIRRDDGIHR